MEHRIFNNFLEYYSLTKGLRDYQKEIIFNCLTIKEQRYLSKAYKTEGWEDLFIRNNIDNIIDELEDDFGINLIRLRIDIISNNVTKKIRKPLWIYINDLFSKYSLRHIWHLFEGITAIDHNEDWMLIVPSKRGKK